MAVEEDNLSASFPKTLHAFFMLPWAVEDNNTLQRLISDALGQSLHAACKAVFLVKKVENDPNCQLAYQRVLKAVSEKDTDCIALSTSDREIIKRLLQQRILLWHISKKGARQALDILDSILSQHPVLEIQSTLPTNSPKTKESIAIKDSRVITRYVLKDIFTAYPDQLRLLSPERMGVIAAFVEAGLNITKPLRMRLSNSVACNAENPLTQSAIQIIFDEPSEAAVHLARHHLKSVWSSDLLEVFERKRPQAKRYLETFAELTDEERKFFREFLDVRGIGARQRLLAALRNTIRLQGSEPNPEA